MCFFFFSVICFICSICLDQSTDSCQYGELVNERNFKCQRISDISKITQSQNAKYRERQNKIFLHIISLKRKYNIVRFDGSTELIYFAIFDKAFKM